MLIPIGWAGLIIGILCIIIGYFTDGTNYLGDIDPEKLETKASLIGGGNGIAELGLLALLVGHIVRAISFLPGRND